MVISSSESKSFRSPSRKMAWSSASSTRICCFVFAISPERHFDCQTRPVAWIRFDGEHPTHSPRTFLYRNGSQPQAVQFVGREPAGKTKTVAVVVYYKY